MRWNLTALIVALVVGVSYGLYQLSYEVQGLTNDLKNVRAEIKKNEQAIQILKAEWAYKNRPDNLQALASKYLPLLLVAPYQVASFQDLPERDLDPNVREILGVPIPRRKPRLVTVAEVPLPKFKFASFRVQQAELER